MSFKNDMDEIVRLSSQASGTLAGAEALSNRLKEKIEAALQNNGKMPLPDEVLEWQNAIKSNYERLHSDVERLKQLCSYLFSSVKAQ